MVQQNEVIPGAAAENVIENESESIVHQYDAVQAPEAIQNLFQLRGTEDPKWFPGL